MAERAVRTDVAFGGRLKQAMARRGVTPTELAKGLEVGQGTVSRWRRGECPSDLRLERIAVYLRVSVEWLRQGIGEIELRVGDPAAQRSGMGRRKEDVALRASAMRKDAARLDVLVRLIQAYRDAGRPASPEILAEWLEIAATNGEDEEPSPPGPVRDGNPRAAHPPEPGAGPARP